MNTETPLIPRPRVVRQRLAQALREVQLLRSLLRLSIKSVTDPAGDDGKPEVGNPKAGRDLR